MRKRTALNRECAPACHAHATALGAHAAEGEGEGEGDVVPNDNPEPLAARMQAHPPTDTRAKPGPPGPHRGYPEEPVGRQHRIMHRPQRPSQAHAPLRRADCSAEIVSVITSPALGHDARPPTLLRHTVMSCAHSRSFIALSPRFTLRGLLAVLHPTNGSHAFIPVRPVRLRARDHV